jgi:hypothetical protein
MPKQNRRSRMISLRLTEREYDALHTLYPSYGVRSISDLARLALQGVIGHPLNSERAFSSNFSTLQGLSERVNTLESQIDLLIEKQTVTK